MSHQEYDKYDILNKKLFSYYMDVLNDTGLDKEQLEFHHYTLIYDIDLHPIYLGEEYACEIFDKRNGLELTENKPVYIYEEQLIQWDLYKRQCKFNKI